MLKASLNSTKLTMEHRGFKYFLHLNSMEQRGFTVLRKYEPYGTAQKSWMFEVNYQLLKIKKVRHNILCHLNTFEDQFFIMWLYFEIIVSKRCCCINTIYTDIWFHIRIIPYSICIHIISAVNKELHEIYTLFVCLFFIGFYKIVINLTKHTINCFISWLNKTMSRN